MAAHSLGRTSRPSLLAVPHQQVWQPHLPWTQPFLTPPHPPAPTAALAPPALPASPSPLSSCQLCTAQHEEQTWHCLGHMCPEKICRDNVPASWHHRSPGQPHALTQQLTLQGGSLTQAPGALPHSRAMSVFGNGSARAPGDKPSPEIPQLPLPWAGLQMPVGTDCSNPHGFCSAGTRTSLAPPAPLASTPGSARPSRTALGVRRGYRKPLAPALRLRKIQAGPASTAKPSGTPLGSGSPPDTSTPMDVDTPHTCDTRVDTDVEMAEDTPHTCDTRVATDVEMEEDTPYTCDTRVATDVEMDDVTVPRAVASQHAPSTASRSGAQRVQSTMGPAVTAPRRAVLRHKVLQKGTLRLFQCYKRTMGTSQQDPGSVPMPVHQGGIRGTSPQHNTTSLGPSHKMPPAGCSGPGPSKAFLSMGHCKGSSTKPQGPQQHAGAKLTPPPPSVSAQAMGLQRRGKKRKLDSGPTSTTKAKCPAPTAGADKGH